MNAKHVGVFFVGKTKGTMRSLERTGKERSVADLCRIDERNVGLVRLDGRRNESEDVQADFLRAESTLGPNVPVKIRQRIAVALNLATYAWFSYEFYTVAALWSLSCLEMALSTKFAEEHPLPLKLTRKQKVLECVPIREVKVRLRHHWRIEGLPNFDFTLRALLVWAQDAGFLPSETDAKAIADFRNDMVHRSEFNWTLMPDQTLHMFDLLIRVVVKLWPE
ncbi:MAG: hypothetical protein ABSH37_13540 [Bryobacteraceae bacterium]